MANSFDADWASGNLVSVAEFNKITYKISDSTLGAAAASFDLTSITQVNAHLVLFLYLRGTATATDA